jgi:hypothetical protein
VVGSCCWALVEAVTIPSDEDGTGSQKLQGQKSTKHHHFVVSNG